MHPIIVLIINVIELYSLAIFIWIVMGLLMYFNILNRHQTVVYKVYHFLERLIEPALRPIRKYVPTISGIDLSPLILILGLNFLQQMIVYYL